MSTTLPERQDDESTSGTAPRTFEGAVAWPASLASRNAAETGEARGLEGERTTKQDFDRADVLRQRYVRGWTAQRRPKFRLKDEWIGRVDEVLDDTFTATLAKRSAPNELEHAEIEVDEVAPEDRSRLRRGAVFYW